MKRSWISWLAIFAMLTMLGAIAGCSSDDDNGPVKLPIDETAFVVAAGDDYFDDYMVTFNGVTSGVNVPAGAFFADYTDYYVVDLRSAADFDNVHVTGAHNIALGSLVDEIDNLPTDQIILFMCYTGQSASFATSIVNLIGTETGHVAKNLKYGASELMPLDMVKADGLFSYPTANTYLPDMVSTASAPKHAEVALPVVDTGESTALAVLKSRARAAIATWIAGSCKGSSAWAADADPTEVYLINYFKESDYLDGHLPHALDYVPGDFTSATALATLPTDMPIGIYCFTGQTSSQVTAYLQMLGYDARSVMYGVQTMAYEDDAINNYPWHANDTDYSAIFSGTGVE